MKRYTSTQKIVNELMYNINMKTRKGLTIQQFGGLALAFVLVAIIIGISATPTTIETTEIIMSPSVKSAI